MDMPGYRKAFKAIKALVVGVSEANKLSAELLASRRQINQLLNWHWKLKPQHSLPEMISGWRGDLMAERLNALCRNTRNKAMARNVSGPCNFIAPGYESYCSR